MGVKTIFLLRMITASRCTTYMIDRLVTHFGQAENAENVDSVVNSLNKACIENLFRSLQEKSELVTEYGTMVAERRISR